MTLLTSYDYKSITISDIDTVGNNPTSVDITGANLVIIKAVGAGGSGGGSESSSDSGAGGGSGGYAEVYLTNDDITHTSISITLGSGGASKDSGVSGSTGGNTTVSINSTLILTANGGAGGSHGNNWSCMGGLGGNASIESGFNGITKSGAYGNNGHDTGTAILFHPGGSGGNSELGAGGRGASYTNTNAGIDGEDGTHGGGGGGGLSTGDSTDFASGAGGDGRVIVYVYK